VWPALYLPKGEAKFEKVDYFSADLAALFKELQAEDFSGYVEILSPHQQGLFLFYKGHLHNCFYDGTEELQLTQGQIFDHFLRQKRRGSETVINASFLPPDVIEALSALEFRRPVYRELETSFLDMGKLFETLAAKHFTGYLRFYHVRSHTRLGNILVKMNKITHDQLQEAVRLQLAQKGALRLGDALVQIGAISPEDLGDALDLQAHARKGSDVEIAVAIFSRGEFRGSYSHMHKLVNFNRDEILPQMVGTEVLVDITEGSLPDAIDLETILSQPPEPKPAPEAPPERIPPSAPAAEPAQEVIHLRGEDLILDLSDTLARSEAGEPQSEAPDQPDAETAPEQAEPETALPAAPEPTPAATPQTYWIPAELHGWEYAAAVVDKFMGPLGKKLLARELKTMGLAGKALDSEQMRELGLRLEKAAGLILGAQQARKLADKINERLD
jgi:hypothetical protein